jgi:hypothetical protein
MFRAVIVMCWIITLGVPTQGVPHLRGYHSTRRGIAVAEHSNPVLRTFFPAGDYLFEITRGGCSCGIGLPETREVSSNQDRLLRRYRDAGWSPTKIARALDDSRRAKGRFNHRAFSTEPLHALQDLVHLLVSAAGHVRFFAYDEGIVRPFKAERSSVSVSAFNELRHLPSYVLLDIHR